MFPNLHQRDNKPQYKTTTSPDIVYYFNIARYMNLYKIVWFQTYEWDFISPDTFWHFASGQ